MRILTGLLILIAMVAATADAQHVLYLKGAVEGTPCKVLEETSEYVLVRIPSALVKRIEPAPAIHLGSAEPLRPSTDAMLAIDDPGASRLLQTEIRERLNEELDAQRRRESGSAVGRILWNGEPLSGCRVRVNLLEQGGVLGGVRRTDTGLETLTDEAGFYRFENLEPGQYKLSWVPSGGHHWVRRLRLDPDFEVEVGETTELEPLEVHAGTLN